ncbi:MULTISPECIES: McrB family protein [Staphylococcus]|uniref:McrB family protein n=1 Tax=Staphylococcus TaxID=1279 RepID=UPI0018873E23|nr:AAA family ATPase [Staphylococcus epidermidis]MBF2285557.1 AAA family ATPase [Staphylococcus epidermidis]MBF2290190.1 AAA family ATPase [Staphylococcus epidermidis]MBF2292482.1 AAA family ATPase [Staphylococcus epidermidis]MBF2294796.1 AAA family ATPase [Staphylococcus epidermidis]MBF2299370.1 AAA family ATPase [Staphylococcus epidermidis]
MINIYVSESSLKNTVNYFIKNEYKSPEQLGLFFFFKSIGLTEKEYINFQKVGKMSNEEKEFYNKKLHQLSGIFTPKEDGKRWTCLFPFSIDYPVKKKSFFNGATEFKNLLSRLTDTIDNTLIDKFLDKNEYGEIKFKRNYLTYIKETFLNNQKISIIHMATWISRFTGFELKSLTNFTNVEFNRICKKYTKDFLRLSEYEFQELFEDDTHNQNISYNQNIIEGSTFRHLFSFKQQPEVFDKHNDINLNNILINQREVNNLMELNDNNPSSQEINNLLHLQKQIILYGVPGVGKSNFVSNIVDNYNPENVVKIQFHPNTTYEDFIGGETIKNGNIETKAGKFLEACEKARNSSENHLFIIDEINRGNISKIFGETIQVLDREYEVDLIKPINIDENEKISAISIPKNMHIIATMNSTDRSIAILDFAIRRRFGFVKLFPNYEIVGNLSDSSLINVNIEFLFRSLNRKILEVLNDEDLLLGQSYFLPDFSTKVNNKIQWKMSNLRYIFNYSIIPALEEYTYGNKNDLLNIVGEKLLNRIDNDNDFNDALIENFPECKK